MRRNHRLGSADRISASVGSMRLLCSARPLQAATCVQPSRWGLRSRPSQ